MIDESLVEIEKSRTLSEQQNLLVELGIGIVSALKGNTDEARKILNSFIKQANDHYFSAYYVAALHFLLGDIDEGFLWLEKAYGQRDYFLVNLKTERTFTALGLNSDPRYIALLRKMNLDT